MKCEKCHAEEATFKIVRIDSGKVRDFHLCQSCAEEASAYLKATKPTMIEELLKQLESKGAKVVIGGKSVEAITQPPCPSCGLDYRTYKTTLMLGCPDCYEAFESVLANDLKRFHGVVQHVGEAPEHQSDVVERQSRLSALKAELQQAIESEDFERAAYLRDEIRRAGNSTATEPTASPAP